MSGRTLRAYVFVSFLHGVFDSAGGLAGVVGVATGLPPVLVGIALIAAISLLGMVVLLRVWHSDESLTSETFSSPSTEASADAMAGVGARNDG